MSVAHSVGRSQLGTLAASCQCVQIIPKSLGPLESQFRVAVYHCTVSVLPCYTAHCSNTTAIWLLSKKQERRKGEKEGDRLVGSKQPRCRSCELIPDVYDNSWETSILGLGRWEGQVSAFCLDISPIQFWTTSVAWPKRQTSSPTAPLLPWNMPLTTRCTDQAQI